MPKYQIKWHCKKCEKSVGPLTGTIINGNDVKPNAVGCPKGGLHQWCLSSSVKIG